MAGIRVQSFLEPVCRRGTTYGRAYPTLGNRVSWNTAEMGENMRRGREEPILDMTEEDQ